MVRNVNHGSFILNFEQLGLGPNLLKAINELGYTEPTEIQEKAIGHLTANDTDFVGQAQTGTGKTAAFVLPLLEKLDPKNKNIQAIILSPTRELANQVSREVEKLSKYTELTSVAIFGGVSYTKQMQDIRRKRPQIIVGTPGRMLDLLRQKVLKFDNVNYGILDEADEMLNMGFFDDVEEILSLVQDDSRLWMFSATMPRPILDLIKKQFRNPEVFKVERKSMSNDSIDQRYHIVRQRFQKEALSRILDSDDKFYGIVFCNTRKDTRELSEELLKKGYSVEVLHGDLKQMDRDMAMKRFKSGKSRLLICTDVAARGIDVTDLTHVVNLGIPQDFESYVHRIGRTGRAGQKGVAITLVDPRDMHRFRRLEKFTNSVVKKCDLPSVESLKNVIVSKDLEGVENVIEAVLGKGENFQVDAIFSQFQEKFSALNKEELLKVVFTWKYNKEFRRLNDLPNLEEELHTRGARSRDGGRDSRDNRGNRGQSDRGPRQRRRTNSDNVRLFVNVGKKDGLHLNSLLDEVSTISGVKRQNIRNVELKERFSFIDVPKDSFEKFSGVKNHKYKGRKVHFEMAQR